MRLPSDDVATFNQCLYPVLLSSATSLYEAHSIFAIMCFFRVSGLGRGWRIWESRHREKNTSENLPGSVGQNCRKQFIWYCITVSAIKTGECDAVVTEKKQKKNIVLCCLSMPCFTSFTKLSLKILVYCNCLVCMKSIWCPGDVKHMHLIYRGTCLPPEEL